MTKEVFPSTRGLTDDEISGKKATVLDPELDNWVHSREPEDDDVEKGDIIAVLGFDKGYLKVRMQDGSIVDRKGGTISWRHNNPGNLKYGEFTQAAGSVGVGHAGHAVFPNYQKGLEAQKKLLFTDARGYNELTLLKAIQKYAPVDDPDADNEPTKYAMFIAKQVGISTGAVLNTLSEEQQTKMVEAMSQYEGWKEGDVE